MSSSEKLTAGIESDEVTKLLDPYVRTSGGFELLGEHRLYTFRRFRDADGHEKIINRAGLGLYAATLIVRENSGTPRGTPLVWHF